MAKTKTVFECQACGNQQSKWVGKCPQCGAWDSFLELNAQQIETLKEISKSTAKPSLAKQISEVEIEKVTRISTQNSELDLVLGGGVVEGSLVLIGGSPGIGKSTLLLKIASNFAAQSKKTLYVSGEERKPNQNARPAPRRSKRRAIFTHGNFTRKHPSRSAQKRV